MRNKNVGERCVRCGHDESNVDMEGRCSFGRSYHSNPKDWRGCHCVFPSAAQSTGERIVREFDGLIYDSDQMKLAKAVNDAISKTKADTWNQAIEAASSVDLYHHPSTNPEHDSLKSAQELRDEIVKVLEAGLRQPT